MPDISTTPDIINRSFAVLEISKHQDIADELLTIFNASELPELTCSVVEGARCQQKLHQVSKKTLKTIRNNIVYCSATVKQTGKTLVTEAYLHICVSKASCFPGAKIHAQLHLSSPPSNNISIIFLLLYICITFCSKYCVQINITKRYYVL